MILITHSNRINDLFISGIVPSNSLMIILFNIIMHTNKSNHLVIRSITHTNYQFILFLVFVSRIQTVL
jgi:hypothetical protein